MTGCQINYGLKNKFYILKDLIKSQTVHKNHIVSFFFLTEPEIIEILTKLRDKFILM
jgi:hypothetical protein